MELVELSQGSPEWHQHRAAHRNASDCPAMLGISPYKTRTQLLHELATGLIKEVDAATQRRFDDGHRFEALARPLAEQIIGQDLYPVVGTEGKFSASFDGITLDESVCFEHKTLNNGIDVANLAEHYRAQMEQQLLVSGASKCLFMASSWDDSDNLIEERHCWYESDPAMRERIISGWAQFERDLAEYQHRDIPDAPQAAAIMDLPALSVQATGMVTYSNLPEFQSAAERYLASINTSLRTDEDFADAEATVKFCKATEEKLDLTKSAILAQTTSIDEVMRAVDHIQAQLRDKRLQLDKLVKSEKERRKTEMVAAIRMKHATHIATLQAEIDGVMLSMLIPQTDFGGVLRGLKSLKSMHDALDTALANAKIEADQIAREVRAKLEWFRQADDALPALFADLQQLLAKPQDDFQAVVNNRIAEHKAEIVRRAEEAAARLQAQADALAKQHVEAEEAEKRKRDAEINAATAAQEVSGIDQNGPALVIANQAVIAAFMKEHDFGKSAGKIRAVIIEFLKFKENYYGNH